MLAFFPSFILLLTFSSYFPPGLALKAFTCGSSSTFNLKEFEFVSPEYPKSLGNTSLSCSFRINHSPSVAFAQNGLSTIVASSESCNNTNQNNETNNDGGGGGEEVDGEDTSDDNDIVPDEPEASICQVRLDFEEFRLQPPLLGNCQFDKMLVTANGHYPLLCGHNTQQHIYLDVAGRSHTDVTFQLDYLKDSLFSCPDRFAFFTSNHTENNNNAEANEVGHAHDAISLTPHKQFAERAQNPTVNILPEDDLPYVDFNTRRAWKIKVTQITCGCKKAFTDGVRKFSARSTGSEDTGNEPLKAPTGCLSYYRGISGSIKSFNYDHVGCYSHDYMCNGKKLGNCDMNAGYTGHLNNLDYSICIEEEYGFCGIEYTANPNETGSFSMTNKTELFTENESDEFESTGARNGDGFCLTDYLVLPGGHCKNDESHYTSDRFCGNRLGVKGRAQGIFQESAPFVVQVVTDRDELTGSVDYMNRGFHLKYHQMPCR